MSVKQAILLVTYRNEILEEYYNLIHEAEINREREHNAAILIQKIWRGKRIRMALKCLIFTTITIQRYFRGFLGRQKFRNSLIEKLRQERMSFFDYNACLIQKFWRGYYSRKVIFDFYRRREYIASIILKMQHVRAYLKVKQQEMTATKKSIQQKEISEKLDQLASTRHHLVGTLAIPGVYSNASPEAPLNDDILKSSSGLQSCLDAIGKNIKGVIIKPPTNYLNPEDVRKITQGPFLPKYILKRTKLKPLNPTLRVETNFYDTRDALKEESRKDVSLRLNHDLPSHKAVQNVWRQMDNFLAGEKYIPVDNRPFQKAGLQQPPEKTRYRVVLEPIECFDQVNVREEHYVVRK